MSNNNGFQSLNSRTRRTRKNINTHLNVLNCLSDDMLNGLLQRFRNQSVVHDINALRKVNHELDSQLLLKSNVVANSKNYKASLYINYTIGGSNVFHFSFHLCPTHTDHRTSGLIHVKQGVPGQEKIRSIRVLRSNNGSFIFKIGKQISLVDIDPVYISEAKIICKVLDMYFNSNNNKFIGLALKTLNRNYTSVQRNKTSSLTTIQSKTRKSLK